jgi:cell division septation protein DedD
VDKQAGTTKPEPSKSLAPGQAEVTTPAAPAAAAKPSAAPPASAKPEKPAEARPAEKAPQKPAEARPAEKAPEKAASRTEEKKAPAPPKAEPKPETKPAAPTPARAAGPIGEPSKGTTWLQVMAVSRTDAEMFVNTLRKKGFSATLAPSTKESLFRVLVGPLADSAAVSRTRAELAEAGFKGANVVKY